MISPAAHSSNRASDDGKVAGGCAEALESSPQGEVTLNITESALSLLATIKTLRDERVLTGGILFFPAGGFVPRAVGPIFFGWSADESISSTGSIAT